MRVSGKGITQPRLRTLRTLRLLAAITLLGSFHAAFAADAADEKIQQAAGDARFAEAFCAADANAITTYRSELQKRAPPTADFANAWRYGWASALNRIIEYHDLSLSNHTDFAARVKEDCGVVKWQAPESNRLCMKGTTAVTGGGCK